MPNICRERAQREKDDDRQFRIAETGDIFESRAEGINIIVADDRTGRE